ncbi:MAG: ABC transporter ATP-binding protein [Candidatus Tectomicrobia bacterium]|nr:ABC transporter ATP-binding protein [Candidatus Tectomicrobia bacterium]
MDPKRNAEPAASADPDAPCIRIRDVEVVYRSRRKPDFLAVRDISLDIRERELFSIVGPTGCGKSTLLLTLSGLLRPERGEVKIRGGSVESARAANQFGFIFQDPVLLPWRTALDNVRLPLEVTGAHGGAQEARCLELLDFVGLSRFRNHFPHELSGGMRQRVSIVRALAHDPSILLLDEPFSSLDEITKRRLHVDFLNLWARERKTALMITHDLYEAVFMSDRVAVMTPGPGEIKAVMEVDLPRPRTAQMRDSDEFVRRAREVRDLLGEF